MQTCDTIETLIKLDCESLDTYPNASNTTFFWNTNRARQIELMSSRAEKITTREATQSTKMSQSGPITTFAISIQESEYSTWTQFTTHWRINASGRNIKNKLL